jgi:hypothetical protein
MAPTDVGVVVWFSAIGAIGLLVVVRDVSARRRWPAGGGPGDLRDLFMCRRGYLGSMVVCTAETFLMKLRRAYENFRPIQGPDGLIAQLPKDSRPPGMREMLHLQMGSKWILNVMTPPPRLSEGTGAMIAYV